MNVYVPLPVDVESLFNIAFTVIAEEVGVIPGFMPRPVIE